MSPSGTRGDRTSHLLGISTTFFINRPLLSVLLYDMHADWCGVATGHLSATRRITMALQGQSLHRS